MLHSIYDLTTSCRQTTGDVPAKLVGASTTVVGSSMYLFGGRQVAERKMVSDMYHFDMDTLKWSRISPHPDDDVPCPRYFHSSDAWGNLLIIFGGMSNQADSTNPEELCVLDDVRIYDLETRRWLPPTADHGPDVPRARYAHLSSVTADRLFIIGGQDFYNTWLDDVCVYDLRSRQWVQRREYPRHCGTYRSVAVSASQVVHTPSHTSSCRLPPPAPSQPSTDATPTGSLVFHPYSAAPTDDNPAEIFLYSNYNFTDVKRELEVFTPHPDDFSINDRSNAMSGTTFPPGLRFPTGALLGNHLIIAGTYLAHSYQSFSIWALDLQTMQWSRIDPGKAVETGSWFRGCLSAHNNKFYIFGNREGSLVDDYNRRLLSWEHVAIVDLEAFGIYQPPAAKVDVAMQELGLSALEEGLMTDFDLVCEDGRKVGVSRKLLDERWPWFREQRRNLLGNAAQAVENLPTSPMHADVPSSHQGSDPRLTPRSLHLSEPYPIVLALAQYFYAQALITPLQQAPAVLSQLLILATNYRIVHLAQLVRHAMHRVLSNSTSVGVYEVATLCNCRSLQIRALKTVMAYTQKRPGAKAKDGRGPPPANSGLDRLGSGQENFSRPRGTSDARWRTAGAGGDGSGTYGSGGRQVTGHQLIESGWTILPANDSEDELDLTTDDEVEDSMSEELPLFTRPDPAALGSGRHHRSQSAVSVTTDQDLRDIAELLATTVSPSLGEATSRPSMAPRKDSLDMNSHPFAASDDDHGAAHTGTHPTRSLTPPAVHRPSVSLSLVTDSRENFLTDMGPMTSPVSATFDTNSLYTSETHSDYTTDGRSSYPDARRISYFTEIRPSHTQDGRQSFGTDGGRYSLGTPSLTSSVSSRYSNGKGPVTPMLTALPNLVEEQLLPPPSPISPYGLPSPSPISAPSLTGSDDSVVWPKKNRNMSSGTPPPIKGPKRSSSSSGTAVSKEGTILPLTGSPTQRKSTFKSLFSSRSKDTDDSIEREQAKEQKRRKAEEKRLRTERLAEDLRARSDARKRAQQDAMSVSSDEKKKRANQGLANMYGGVAGGPVVM